MGLQEDLRHAPVPQGVEAPVAGPEPKRALPVLVQRGDPLAQGPLGLRTHGNGFQPAPAPQGQPALRADPKPAVAAAANGVDGAVGQAVLRTDHRTLRVRKAAHPVIRAQPHVAFAIFEDPFEVSVGRPLRESDALALQRGRLEALQAGVDAGDPKQAVTVDQQCPDGRGPCAPQRDGDEAVVVQTGQAPVGAGPEPPLGIGTKALT